MCAQGRGSDTEDQQQVVGHHERNPDGHHHSADQLQCNVSKGPEVVAKRVQDLGGLGGPIPRCYSVTKVFDQPQGCPCIKAVTPDLFTDFSGHGPQEKDCAQHVRKRGKQPGAADLDSGLSSQSILRELEYPHRLFGGSA